MSGIKKVKLGSQGLVVPNIGLGCMGMTEIAGMQVYGQADEKESIVPLGVSTGDRYDVMSMAMIDA